MDAMKNRKKKKKKRWTKGALGDYFTWKVRKAPLR